MHLLIKLHSLSHASCKSVYCCRAAGFWLLVFVSLDSLPSRWCSVEVVVAMEPLVVVLPVLDTLVRIFRVTVEDED